MNAPTPATWAMQPPSNVEAEQAVIGAVLVNNAAWHAIGDRLKPEHFTQEIHQRIWEVASTLIGEARVASPLTLKTYLGDHDLGGVTVPHYLARLAANATTIVNAPDYARMVAELAVRREVLTVSAEMAAEAHDPPAGMSIEQLIERLEAAVAGVRDRSLAHTASTRVTAGDAAAALIDKVKRIRGGEKIASGATTGFPDLDHDTGGIRPGDLWIVAGRPAMGKSIIGGCIARAVARSGVGTMLFPFEIGREQAIARVLSDLAYNSRKRLGYGQILRGEVDEEGLWDIEEAQKQLASMPLVIDDADGATLAQINARVRSERDRMARAGVKLGVVVIDYLNFVKASDRYQGQRHNEIGEISIGLKRMAKALGVGVVLLAQVNRGTEGRDEKRPQLADLKDSGSLESDADVVAFVYREIYYLEKSAAYLRKDPETVARANDVRNELEVIVGKNRTGATRGHKLWIDVACSLVSAKARGTWA